MKTALIPPAAHLDEFGRGDFHLLLGHVDSSEYRAHYTGQGAQGAFMVLDNGAHENVRGMNSRALLLRAAELGASEVVAPDVLFRSQLTVSRTTKALERWAGVDRELFESLGLSVMLVPQGEDAWAWRTCLQSILWTYERLADKHPGLFKEPTIGISKDYILWPGGLSKLLEQAVIPLGHPVHLLGWANDLWTLGEIAHRWPQIRSTDSARPFTYALRGIALDPTDEVPTYERRQGDYFGLELTPDQIELAWHNVGVFRELANDHRDD